MARPVKQRHVAGQPAATHFIPTAGEAPELPVNVLKMEELEALRLKDLEGYEQTACAQQMAVSRPTFHRILLSARAKVADSLLHGKAIRIEGGDYLSVGRAGHCARCGRTWQVPEPEQEHNETDRELPPAAEICPECQTDTRGLSASGRRRRSGGRP